MNGAAAVQTLAAADGQQTPDRRSNWTRMSRATADGPVAKFVAKTACRFC